MLKRAIVIIATSIAISACAPLSNNPSTKAASIEKSDALSRTPKEGYALLYLYRTDEFADSGVTASFRINDIRLGEIYDGFFSVDLIPGNHEIRSFIPPIEEERFYANLPAAYAERRLIELSAKAGEVVYVRYSAPPNTLATANKNSALQEIQSLDYYAGDFTVMNERIITAEDKAWESCQQATTAAPCQQFLVNYPNSRFKPDTNNRINEFKQAEAIAREKAKFARDSALPLEVRKDKYMVALTSKLSKQNYEQALPYFKQLDNLNIELSPTFNYFYGETLLKLGKPTEAIEKLYSYITTAGSSGKYYTKALELVNEAEAIEYQ
jgi:tetratricopeptide (TPR) repeat protein